MNEPISQTIVNLSHSALITRNNAAPSSKLLPVARIFHYRPYIFSQGGCWCHLSLPAFPTQCFCCFYCINVIVQV